MLSSPTDTTMLLLDARRGRPEAAEALFVAVHDELSRIAEGLLRSRRAGQTLDAVALVNEAYLRLVDRTRVEVRDRAHFFALAATCMRGILVDYARRRQAGKRGGDRQRVTLDAFHAVDVDRSDTLLALDEALDHLARFDARMAKVVECRFFGGLSAEETAAALDTSVRTVERDWTRAKAHLVAQLQG